MKDFQNTYNDLVIIGGAFTISPSVQQHASDIIESEPGYYKQHAEIGIGIAGNLNGTIDIQSLEKNIRLQFANDGIEVESLKVNADNIEIRIKDEKN
jgi:hypothetical protein